MAKTPSNIVNHVVGRINRTQALKSARRRATRIFSPVDAAFRFLLTWPEAHPPSGLLAAINPMRSVQRVTVWCVTPIVRATRRPLALTKASGRIAFEEMIVNGKLRRGGLARRSHRHPQQRRLSNDDAPTESEARHDLTSSDAARIRPCHDHLGIVSRKGRRECRCQRFSAINRIFSPNRGYPYLVRLWAQTRLPGLRAERGRQPAGQNPPWPRRDGGRLGRWQFRYVTEYTREAAIRPEPRQQRGVVPAPSTADPALRGCSAVAAAQHAPAAAAPDRRPAAP